jgi:hypothetical protein
MNGEAATGPLMLGRWQKPAAQINAGLVPPDPYPVEKILFCAGCGQQFFGTHIGGTRVTDGVRVYRTFCDCRPGPLPAGEVELQVYAETHIHAFDTDTVAGLTSAHYALLAVRFFTRIELGPTAEHIRFTARI